jgi:hypothetical protein
MQTTLSVSASATFISDGAGGTVARVTLSPTVFGTEWDVKRMSVSTTSVAQTTLRTYRNIETPSAFIDGTSKANANISNMEIHLQTLDKLIFVFTGGDIGAIATAIVDGTYETGRPI